MSDGAMLESSILLHRDSANCLLALARMDSLEALVSGNFLDVAKSGSEGLVRRHRPLLTDPGLGIMIDKDKLMAQVGEPRPYLPRSRSMKSTLLDRQNVDQGGNHDESRTTGCWACRDVRGHMPVLTGTNRHLLGSSVQRLRLDSVDHSQRGGELRQFSGNAGTR